MHDADVRNIPGKMSQANNRAGDIWLTECNDIALKMDFERTPFTWVIARKPIHRAYYQQQVWIRAPVRDATLAMNTELEDFVRKGNNGSWYSNLLTWRPAGSLQVWQIHQQEWVLLHGSWDLVLEPTACCMATVISGLFVYAIFA